MNTTARLAAYTRQNGASSLTARQTRRINKKAQLEFGDYRQRWAGVEVNEP